MNMHSLAVKIISLTVLFVVTFTAGVIPLKLRRKRTESDADRQALRDHRRKQLISLCTCFAGGVFFASSMLELIPVVREDFKAIFDAAKISTDFPVAEFGIAIGFFLILTLEQIIHVVKESSNHTHANDSTSAPLLRNGQTSSSMIGHQQHNSSHFENDSGESDDEPDNPASSVVLQKSHDVDHSDYQYVQGVEDELTTTDEGHERAIFTRINEKHHNHRHYLRSYLLLIALSVHALFEGLAVGLFEKIDGMVQVLGALVVHKCVLAFSIGVNLVQHSFPALTVAKSAFLFSAMSPFGIGIGILMLTYASSNIGRILSAIFQAIATGTFLYVTFFEIFFHELKSKECHRMLKVLMMILGFSLTAIVQYFETKMQ